MSDTQQVECDYGCIFDETAAKGLSVVDVRRRWPRFEGACARCEYRGIYYASYVHYLMGGW